MSGSADTLARMAQVVGVTPEQLADAGREDAAEELRALPPLDQPAPEPTVADLADRVERLEQAVQPRPPRPDEETRVYTIDELQAMSPAEQFELLQRQLELKQEAQRQIDAHLEAMIRIIRETTPLNDDTKADQE